MPIGDLFQMLPIQGRTVMSLVGWGRIPARACLSLHKVARYSHSRRHGSVEVLRAGNQLLSGHHFDLRRTMSFASASNAFVLSREVSAALRNDEPVVALGRQLFSSKSYMA